MKHAMLTGIILGLASTHAFGEPIALGDGDLKTVSAGLLDVAPATVNVPPIDFGTLKLPNVTTVLTTPTTTNVVVQINKILNLLNEGDFNADVAQDAGVLQIAPVGQ